MPWRESYIPSNNRSQLTVTPAQQTGGGCLQCRQPHVDDGRAAELQYVMDVPAKMVIIGDMGELGEVSHEEHQKVVEYLKNAHFIDTWLVGKEFEPIATSASSVIM